MKKYINKIIIILIILIALIIGLVFFQSYEKTKTIKLEENNLVSEIEITYDVRANPLSKVEVKDLTNTDAKINSCVGSLGQSIDISGNFFNFQLKEAQVTMKYDETKLKDTDEERIGILWYDKENQKMITVDSTIDTENNTISFNTSHFSEYIIVDLDKWEAAWQERVVRVREESDSFNIAFVIDDSGSMSSNDPKNLRLEATENFVEILENKDKYSVVKFETSANIIQETTGDKSKVKEIKEKFQSNGGTNIASGLEKGLELLENDTDNSKVIVLLTDGEDTTLSSKKEEIINKAIDNNIIIFTIFLNTGDNTNEGNTTDIADIATQTSGNFYTINTDEIIDIFKKISKVSVGVDGTQDTDGDGIPDEIELGGMRTAFGNIVYTNPYSKDTDGDGLSDATELGWTNQNNGQIYVYISDPTRKNALLIQEFSAGITNKSKSLGTWDSGFKLNRDAFQFQNISVKGNSGVCEGIAYIIQRTYNQEKIVREENSPINAIYLYNKTKNEAEKYTENDTDTIITEKNETQIEINHHINGYNVKDTTLDIIFDKHLPYFYYPNTNELKNGKSISSEYLTKNNADSNLINSLFYYWGYGNNLWKDKISSGELDNNIDITKSVTDETISKLKVLFNNKKIVTIRILGNYGHTINGYALEKKSESKYYLYVYDNNYPYSKEKNQYIILEKIPNSNLYSIKYNNAVNIAANNEDKDFFIIEYKDEYINFSKENLEI